MPCFLTYVTMCLIPQHVKDFNHATIPNPDHFVHRNVKNSKAPQLRGFYVLYLPFYALAPAPSSTFR